MDFLDIVAGRLVAHTHSGVIGHGRTVEILENLMSVRLEKLLNGRTDISSSCPKKV